VPFGEAKFSQGRKPVRNLRDAELRKPAFVQQQREITL
jgi:hypothetical protein